MKLFDVAVGFQMIENGLTMRDPELCERLPALIATDRSREKGLFARSNQVVVVPTAGRRLLAFVVYSGLLACE